MATFWRWLKWAASGSAVSCSAWASRARASASKTKYSGVQAEIIEGFPRPFKGTFKAGEEYPGVLGHLGKLLPLRLRE